VTFETQPSENPKTRSTLRWSGELMGNNVSAPGNKVVTMLWLSECSRAAFGETPKVRQGHGRAQASSQLVGVFLPSMVATDNGVTTVGVPCRGGGSER
jgi:hypothetical protein